MDDTSEVVELPLFPLNTVLFPGQRLPLHIFEPRYQQMIRHCLAEELPFGVVLIRKGNEAGDEAAEPYPVGTVAHIVESTELPDGTMEIVAMGTDRFRIRRLLRDLPYLRGEVATIAIAPPSSSDEANADTGLARHVRQQVKRYIDLIADAAGLQIRVGEMPSTPRKIGYLAAIAMQIDNADKQKLLDCDSTNEVLAAASTLLNRENALLTWMVGSKDWPDEAQFGPSGTLLPN